RARRSRRGARATMRVTFSLDLLLLRAGDRVLKLLAHLPPQQHERRNQSAAEQEDTGRFGNGWWPTNGAARSARKPIHALALGEEQRAVAYVRRNEITARSAGGDNHELVRIPV